MSSCLAVCLYLAPVFFTAAIHAAVVEALADALPTLRHLSPVLVDGLFIGLDIACFALVVVGSALDTTTGRGAASILLLAGLAVELTTLTAVVAVLVDLWVIRSRSTHPRRFTWRRRISLLALALASLFLVVRCAYDVADVCRGWLSVLEETTLLIVDGVLTLVVGLVLCVVHAARIPQVSISEETAEQK